MAQRVVERQPKPSTRHGSGQLRRLACDFNRDTNSAEVTATSGHVP